MFFFHNSRLVGLIWVDKTTVRIIVPNMSDEKDVSEEQALEIIRNNIAPNELNIKKISWFNTFSINERRAEAHYKGNVYLCGDTAHVHSSAGGQGMNTGIQDSYNLAQKLALIMKGVGQLDILNETFHIERAAVAEMVLRNSGNIVRRTMFSSTLNNTMVLNYIFPFAMSCDPIRHQASNSLAEVFIKYEHNNLIRNRVPSWVYNSEVPGVGLRLPSFDLFKTITNNLTTTHKVIKGGALL